MVSEPKEFNWSNSKNEWLKQERGISFEEITFHIARRDILDIVDNPNYPDQKMYILCIREYAWIVPFIQSYSEILLITAYPNRKATRIYLTNKQGTTRCNREQAYDTG